MAKFWDDDIAKLKLTDEEKNGLQVFRNYSGAFEEHRCRTFSAQVDSQAFPLEPLTRVVALIKEEDPRFLPVIASSFIDEHLKEMFHRDIPENIPGGRAGLLNGFGPLSRLSQKLQIAYAFGWLSEDLILDADKLRKIRNDISHKWDLAELSSKLDELVDQRLSPIEDHLEDEKNFSRVFFKDLDRFTLLRVRLVWIMGRIYYETKLYSRAVKSRLDATKALYGKQHPKALGLISGLCIEATNTIVSRTKSS